MKNKNAVLKILAELCRLLIGVVFIFSGFVKAVDPMGGAIKIGEYLASFGLDMLQPFTVLLSFNLSAIEFEYLEMKGKISGKKRQKLHLWKKREIQTMCEHKAHRYGIRVSRVCAWNTSRLAYDGSGPVSRDPKNHSLCVFQSGKQYNCDLSASYNIGARYWIREIIKTLPETERSSLEAKVPAVKRRTSCVYADLLILQNEYGCSKAA